MIFAGGGTGGHLYPGLAVAAALHQRCPSVRMFFVGSNRPVERQIMQRQPWRHVPLSAMSPAALCRRPWTFFIGNWQAFQEARRICRIQKPLVVVGLGGFASVPILWAAARERIPLLLLETNAVPGRATRWFANVARHVCVTFPEAAKRLPSQDRVDITGTPVRAEIAALAGHSHSTDSPPTLLILGGSQGAEGLNRAVVAWLTGNSPAFADWRIVHQTGPNGATEFDEEYRRAGLDCRVATFLDDIAAEYAAATVIVSRAGASTLAELACAGRPVLLVPFPDAADDHQAKNAAHWVTAGAAMQISQQQTPEETAAEMSKAWRVMQVDDSRSRMSAAAKSLARTDAAERVAELVLEELNRAHRS